MGCKLDASIGTSLVLFSRNKGPIISPNSACTEGLWRCRVRRGYGLLLAPSAPRICSQTSVFTRFGEGHSRLVETKWSVTGVFAVKQWFRDISVPRCLAGCLDAWMPGCLHAWMPGCLDAWICWSKMFNSTFLNFLAIRLIPYSNLSHSLFNPRLSSLVPSKIVQVESEKHGFRFKTNEET